MFGFMHRPTVSHLADADLYPVAAGRDSRDRMKYKHRPRCWNVAAVGIRTVCQQ